MEKPTKKKVKRFLITKDQVINVSGHNISPTGYCEINYRTKFNDPNDTIVELEFYEYEIIKGKFMTASGYKQVKFYPTPQQMMNFGIFLINLAAERLNHALQKG